MTQANDITPANPEFAKAVENGVSTALNALAAGKRIRKGSRAAKVAAVAAVPPTSGPTMTEVTAALTVQEFDPDELTLPPDGNISRLFSAKHTLSEEHITRMAENIRENGQLQDGLVLLRPDNSKPWIIIGATRCEAIKRLRQAGGGGDRKFRARVAPEWMEGRIAEVSIAENLVRQDPSRMDIAYAVDYLQRHGRKVKEIATLFGFKSEGSVSQYAGLTRLLEPLKLLVAREQIGFLDAYTLSTKDEPTQAAALQAFKRTHPDLFPEEQVIAGGQNTPGPAEQAGEVVSEPSASKAGVRARAPRVGSAEVAAATRPPSATADGVDAPMTAKEIALLWKGIEDEFERDDETLLASLASMVQSVHAGREPRSAIVSALRQLVKRKK